MVSPTVADTTTSTTQANSKNYTSEDKQKLQAMLDANRQLQAVLERTRKMS